MPITALSGVINVKDPPDGLTPAIGEGITDDAPAIRAMLAFYGSGIRLMVPPGDYLLGSAVRPPADASNITIEGAGIGMTRFFANSQISFLFSGAASGETYEIEFEDITFDCQRLTNICMNVGGRDRGWKWRRCEFKNMKTAGISSGGCNYGVAENCEFTNEDGVPSTWGLSLDQGGRGWRVRGCTFHWQRAPITTGTSGGIPRFNDQYTDNYVNGHWWTLPTAVAGSGGTVTYTGNTVVDSSAPFGTVSAGYVSRSRVCRVLVPTVTGTITTFPNRNRIQDSGASFTNVKPGSIVRLADRWAVVDKIGTISTLNDTVFVGQWWSTTTATWGTRMPGPSTASLYAIYEVYWGSVTAITSTTVTVDTAWAKLTSGAIVTPPSGTLYELMILHNDLRGFHLVPGAHDCSITNNTIEQTWREGVFSYGSGTRIIGNSIRFVQDHCITSASSADDGVTYSLSGDVVQGNVLQAAGACGIAVYGCDATVTGNVVEGCALSPTIVTRYPVQITGSRVVMTGNKITNTPAGGWELPSAISDYALRIDDGTNNLIADNLCSDFPLGFVNVEAGAGAGNEFRNNKGGTIAVDVAAAVPLIEHSGTGAPTMRAAAGSIWHRTDGGAGTCLYVKESSTGSSNWVAK